MMAVAAGVAVSVTVAIVVSKAGRSMPAMAAVEVHLVVPTAKPAPATLGPADLQQDSWVSSDWEKDDRYSPIRGNVLGIEGESAGVRVVDVSYPTVGPAKSLAAAAKPAALAAEANPYSDDPNVRWFNARPVRPAKTMWMTVTGYTPDEQSCGDSADGLTATMHSVNTNAMRMVAADTSVLPYGSMVSVPGYDDASIVPVLDCGGAIKGAKLDLLFATNQEAKQWGKQRVLVTVWEYADGKPADNPRKLR